MTFRILGLDPAPYIPLYGQSEAALAHAGAQRCTADARPGFPDRVELRDAEPGENLLLLNHTHLPANNPYRASHAIFVREGARQRYDRIDEVPEALRVRMLSVRSFDRDAMMLDAALVNGTELEAVIERLLAPPTVEFLHVHYATRGCYAARVERVG
jgi:hypothetical protein